MELNDTSRAVLRYTDAVKRKYKNKSVTLIEQDGDVYFLEILNLDKEFAKEPSVKHTTLKGIVRVSGIRMSRETLEAFIINAIELLNKTNI